MSSRKKQNPDAGPAGRPAGGEAEFGRKGRVLLAAGLALAALGYVLLKKADPAGSNLCAKLAPAVLLAGYLLIPAALCAAAGPAGAARPSAASYADRLQLRPPFRQTAKPEKRQL